MGAPAIDLNELDPEVRKSLGVRTPRTVRFSKEELRSWSLKVLACMAGLTQEQRERVLRHAMKVNRV